MAGTPLQIVVGLGNPGPEHRLTRHNAGFWFVDALAYRHGVQFRAHARYQGEIAKVVVEGRDLPPSSRAIALWAVPMPPLYPSTLSLSKGRPCS